MYVCLPPKKQKNCLYLSVVLNLLVFQFCTFENLPYQQNDPHKQFEIIIQNIIISTQLQQQQQQQTKTPNKKTIQQQPIEKCN